MAEAHPGRVGRRLAAIVAADVAGYSRLMGLDEVGTAHTLREHRKVTDALVAKHGGRLVKSTGDGVLLEFSSIVDAVECAVAVQVVMAERNEGVPVDRRMMFRIGINLGDILIEEGDDILGDGVNIAARLEGIAEPGGICISASAYEQVRGKVPADFTDLGEKSLKNIARPIRAYALGNDGLDARTKSKSTTATAPGAPFPPALGSPNDAASSEFALKGTPPLPAKPSIAVLPFQNMSGDPEQDYFADGMVEDIITALSRFGELFVIARNSTFTYKGKAVDIRQVGRELGVRCVLEGSVRKMGNRVRITGQLIDAGSGAHLWGDRFEGDLQGIFDLQDQITARVANAVAPKIVDVEIDRVAHKPTASLDAYDHYLRGLAGYYKYEKEATDEALRYFIKAIQLDPDFAPAYALASSCYWLRKAHGWMVDAPKEITEGTRLARRAAELGKNDATALCFAGVTLAHVAGDLDAGANLINRALLLNPNSAVALFFRSWIKGWIGEPDQAVDDGLGAMRLDPLAPRLSYMQASIAYGHFFAGRYGEASSWAERSIQEQISPVALRVLAASLALAGKREDARDAAVRLMQLVPALRVSHIKTLIPIRRPDDLARLEEGLRLAGLPEG
ncbi:adenylate/guanylate cyclase domain-containing protein [Bradyrhizobium sp. CER78]|uniref:adenylate/guanylate cyclase domain-containing protein n=1 Tax=Bradyrhizobium sp. CER78 TaxID=3039162 RepID=UPI002447B5B7|nr:adenylate/guanylate cyclase domain-containing protein [Bradyrhizobium sp. CER78]MDH2380786.1 adenylate/guanylate cyclase domain-containing protein [Bradyrhizobium sp. CER78]